MLHSSHTRRPRPPPPHFPLQGADLVVDGVVASCHSEWFLDALVPASMVRYLPAIYEATLTPVYWLYRLVGAASARWLAEDVGLVQAVDAALRSTALAFSA